MTQFKTIPVEERAGPKQATGNFSDSQRVLLVVRAGIGLGVQVPSRPGNPVSFGLAVGILRGPAVDTR